MTRVIATGAFTALAWAAYLLHDQVELPEIDLDSWEYVAPTALYLVLFLAWWLVESRPTRILFVAWAWIMMLGAGLFSALPLPFLPYDPPQTVQHYAVHGILILAHVPLVRALNRTRT